jgi:hypothetical protein
MSLDLVPVLLLSLLLLTSGGDADRVELLTGGTHEVADSSGAVVVTDGDVTVPASVTVDGPVHVLGGVVRVEGDVTGGVVVVGGAVDVAATAQVGGAVRHLGGELALAPGSAARVETPDLAATRRGPVEDVVTTLAGAGLLAAVAAGWTRRRPNAPRTVGDAMRRHPVVVLTVGALVAVTGISVLVFMAFTLVLLPVSVLGLVVGAGLVASGVVGAGELVGRRLPLHGRVRATAAGVVVVVVVVRALGLVPLVGDLLALAVLLAGLGAVLVTYLGLKPFVPVALPR